jgi:hypothetical protein
MLESMWDSMSSSMQLAQECLERNEEEDASDLNDPSNMDGLEKFAQTIDNSECCFAFGHDLTIQFHTNNSIRQF